MRFDGVSLPGDAVVVDLERDGDAVSSAAGLPCGRSLITLALRDWSAATWGKPGMAAGCRGRLGGCLRLSCAPVARRWLPGSYRVVRPWACERLEIPLPSATASGSPNRLLCPDSVRYMSAISGSVERMTAYCDGLRRRLECVAEADRVGYSRSSVWHKRT